ncbi:MAG: DUF3530 family protein [Methylococcaceae bacterium]|nr:MAG: DUF3530 family protein [Methylococcaceae bacterium]
MVKSPGRLLAGLLLLLVSSSRADPISERLIAEDIAPGLAPGEMVWLHTPKERFWAVVKDAWRKELKGTAIIVPDNAEHPTSSYLIAPFTASFRQAGWTVLILQPSTGGGPAFDLINLQRTAQRLEAGLAFVEHKDHAQTALLGIGSGALTVLDYAAGHPVPPTPLPVPLGVKLIAMVDAPLNYPPETKRQIKEVLGNIGMPVADFYLAHTQAGEQLENAAKQRRVAARGNSDYRQVRFSDLDPAMWTEQNLLGQRLVGWFSKTMAAQLDKLQQQAEKLTQKKSPGQTAAEQPAVGPL